MRAMDKLDTLEGSLLQEAGKSNEGKNVFAIEGLNEVEVKVHGTLRRNIKAWEEAGAGSFVMSVIQDGFKFNMNQMTEDYEEKN